eukprot:CAMPEP_0182423752 /NCGR_PEP_ID=MMETSP1167-20130531/9842_1 /TAXON_ID=2988 /ORGANISM="Mallomonas Sp, Strain CCMP3275" /LENGTH=291 /DNA_ID=CAMNT_0024603011 /DNA_START=272 /DNA_END=1147 /DNA_ORIENTATION=-
MNNNPFDHLYEEGAEDEEPRDFDEAPHHRFPHFNLTGDSSYDFDSQTYHAANFDDLTETESYECEHIQLILEPSIFQPGESRPSNPPIDGYEAAEIIKSANQSIFDRHPNRQAKDSIMTTIKDIANRWTTTNTYQDTIYSTNWVLIEGLDPDTPPHILYRILFLLQTHLQVDFTEYNLTVHAQSTWNFNTQGYRCCFLAKTTHQLRASVTATSTPYQITQQIHIDHTYDEPFLLLLHTTLPPTKIQDDVPNHLSSDTTNRTGSSLHKVSIIRALSLSTPHTEPPPATKRPP